MAQGGVTVTNRRDGVTQEQGRKHFGIHIATACRPLSELTAKQQEGQGKRQGDGVGVSKEPW